MPKQNDFVVYDGATNGYLISWTGSQTYDNCTWGSSGSAYSYSTIELAQEAAGRIGHGTTGVPRPS